MLDLILAAYRVLVDPQAKPSLSKAAGVTVLEALDAELHVPVDDTLAIRRWARWNPDLAATVLHRYDLIDDTIATEAIEILLNPDTGELLRDLAVSVLRGANLRHVTDEQLFQLATQVTSEKAARRLQSVVDRAGEARTVLPEAMRSIRNSLFASSDHNIRLVAVEIFANSGSFDEAFVRSCLGDISPEVRASDQRQLLLQTH